MGSTRLPGKVMLPLEGKTVLEHVLRRLRHVNFLGSIVVATTTNKIDAPIYELSTRLGFRCFRGSELDVLSRYYHAAKEMGAQLIIRCNADCPLIDPKVVELIISTFLQKSDQYDYVSNILRPTFPTGMHCEAFSFEALQNAYENALDPLEREHVTPYIYRRPNKFRLHNVQLGEDLSSYRWTLDLPEDFVLISKIYQALYKYDAVFSMLSIIELLNKNPEWSLINGHISKSATV